MNKVSQVESKLYTIAQQKFDNQEFTRLLNAVSYVKNVHSKQLRKNLDPYVIHVLYVAIFLCEWDFGLNSVITGLLHDIVEDQNINLADIKEEFGDDVVKMIGMVTKVDFKKPKNKKEVNLIYKENLHRILINMCHEPRIIGIKLADRLHNLLTIYYFPFSKQKRIILETINIYLPLAYKFQMHEFIKLAGDVILRVQNRNKYYNIVSNVNYLKKTYYNEIMSIIDKFNKLPNNIHVVNKDWRIKSPFSIYNKMVQKKLKFDELYDLFAIRIIVATKDMCYNVLSFVDGIFTTNSKRFKDYIASPKLNGYQSIHTVINYNNHNYEIQIRTDKMHNHSINGLSAHFRYKSPNNSLGHLDKHFAFLNKLTSNTLSQVLKLEKEKKSKDWILSYFYQNFLQEQIMVYTPQKDIILLRKNSCVIDFAFKIHSDIGFCVKGAKINDIYCPITTTLQNGDIVDIITSKRHTVNDKWLKFVKTKQAAHSIRTFLKKQQHSLLEEAISIGKKRFAQFQKENSNSFPENSKDFVKLLEKKGWSNIETFYIELANDRTILKRLLPSKNLSPYLPKNEHISIKPKTNKSLCLVDGEPLMIKLGKCCTPLFGDVVVGQLNRSGWVTIHLKNCNNIIKNIKNQSQRIMTNISWNTEFKNTLLPVGIKLIFPYYSIIDKTNLSAITKTDDWCIKKISESKQYDNLIFVLECEMKTTAALEKFKNIIRNKFNDVEIERCHE